ncbi:hypothetical protein [Halorussus marinus]|nr:hypothetical protein [Halorussus marinus]
MSDEQDNPGDAERVAEAIDEIGVERLSDILTDVFSEAVKAERADDPE